ncbi:hypothetical protein NPIL_386561 [Nephila pilipes]|uniref:Uncharacterized protein n=1 Tax=Nephila pilipes TaxID=299642 RepID=A0A8X6KF26_NEPPI|nr:hypothetical protein NPIL_386561 [Nephila pilipes]
MLLLAQGAIKLFRRLSLQLQAENRWKKLSCSAKGIEPDLIVKECCPRPESYSSTSFQLLDMSCLYPSHPRMRLTYIISSIDKLTQHQPYIIFIIIIMDTIIYYPSSFWFPLVKLV